jgi:hypothetical protein
VTDAQLYLSVGIPTFAVLITLLTNIIHHNSVNARFTGLEGTINARFSNLESRFNNLDVKFDTLTGKVIDLDNRVTRIEAKLGIG